MLGWASLFVLLAVVAAHVGLGGLAASAVGTAITLFALFVIAAVASFALRLSGDDAR